MATILVTVAGPEKLIDLELPGETPISDLLPLLVEVCVPRMATTQWAAADYWGLGYPESRPFSPARTLVECGVYDGEVLAFQDLGSWPQPPALLVGTPAGNAPPAGTPADDGIVIRWNKEGLLS